MQDSGYRAGLRIADCEFKNKETVVRRQELGRRRQLTERTGTVDAAKEIEVGSRRSEDPRCRMQDAGCRIQGRIAD
jgi:hypothetical protein